MSAAAATCVGYVEIQLRAAHTKNDNYKYTQADGGVHTITITTMKKDTHAVSFILGPQTQTFHMCPLVNRVAA